MRAVRGTAAALSAWMQPCLRARMSAGIVWPLNSYIVPCRNVSQQEAFKLRQVKRWTLLPSCGQAKCARSTFYGNSTLCWEKQQRHLRKERQLLKYYI